MEAKLKFHAELIFRYIVLVLGFLIVIFSIKYGFGNLRHPGSGLYTFFVGILIMIFSLIHIILPGKKTEGSEPLFNNNLELKKFLCMGIVFIFWIIGMPYLGYAIITFIATFFFSKISGLEGWLKPLALSAITSVFIYLLFDYWLYIDLPKGIILG